MSIGNTIPCKNLNVGPNIKHDSFGQKIKNDPLTGEPLVPVGENMTELTSPIWTHLYEPRIERAHRLRMRIIETGRCNYIMWWTARYSLLPFYSGYEGSDLMIYGVQWRHWYLSNMSLPKRIAKRLIWFSRNTLSNLSDHSEAITTWIWAPLLFLFVYGMACIEAWQNGPSL